MCDDKVPWHAEVSLGLKSKIEDWVRDINSVKTELPRSIGLAHESITAIEFHVFADASIVADFAADYAVVYEPNSVNQVLVTSNSPFFKHYITNP